jgi:hypothetical protein
MKSTIAYLWQFEVFGSYLFNVLSGVRTRTVHAAGGKQFYNKKSFNIIIPNQSGSVSWHFDMTLLKLFWCIQESYIVLIHVYYTMYILT